MAFHEVRFPTAIAFGSRGGPNRKTVIATSGSGFEARNSQWADSRRDYNAGYGVKSDDDIHAIIEFFEERRGMLHGFRWKDRFDFSSTLPRSAPAFDDQEIGTGDGVEVNFQMVKWYGSTYAPYSRDINKPVSGTALSGVNGVAKTAGVDFTVDYTTGIITYVVPPPVAHVVTAGFEFDVPVRFDTDSLQIDLSAFDAGDIPDIPLKEVRI